MSTGRRTAITIAATAVMVIAAAVLGWFLLRPPGSAGDASTPLEIETAQVERGELSEQLRAQGTLAYASPHTLGTTLGGTLTGLPGIGTTVGAGQELFRVDDRPIVLMLGELPVWRSFESGMSAGRDVLQLETNLAALGFLSRTPDEKFDWHTSRAVEDWQKSVGLDRTGMIELGRIVFAPTELRVAAHEAAIGAPAGEQLVAVTSTAKQVQAFVDTAQQALVEVGAVIEVTLPGGIPSEATVVATGAPVERDGASGKTLKIPVTLTLNDPEAGAALDNVSVSLRLTVVRAEDALIVPVSALLAQPGGGFAVQLVTGEAAAGGAPGSGKPGPATTLVPVELGAFASGFVAVTDGALAEGDVVVVAK